MDDGAQPPPGAGAPVLRLRDRQRSEQCSTRSQSRSHFLRQAKGRWQVAHSLLGNSDFFRILGIQKPRVSWSSVDAVAIGDADVAAARARFARPGPVLRAREP